MNPQNGTQPPPARTACPGSHQTATVTRWYTQPPGVPHRGICGQCNREYKLRADGTTIRHHRIP